MWRIVRTYRRILTIGRRAENRTNSPVAFRNTDRRDAIKWGLEAIYLLNELREMDPKRYDREVKHPTPETP